MSTVIDLASRKSPPPVLESGKVSARKGKKHTDVRSREYLTESEVEALMKAAYKGRWGQRDATLVMMMFRHGLRVSEAVALRWDVVDLQKGLLAVTRRKNGRPSTHPLRGPELRALRQLRRDWPDSPYLFVSERGGPMTTSNVRKLVASLGVRARLSFPVHPHQLRHACGYALANAGHDTRALQQYLGHSNIQHTVRYTELTPDRFKAFFSD